MIDYRFSIGDLVEIQSPTFLAGQVGYIKELRELVTLVNGDDNRTAGYHVYLFDRSEVIFFGEDQLEPATHS